MTGEPLSLRIADGVATLTIDRPQKKNALTQSMWIELASLVSGLAAASGDVRAMVLRGAGGDFCAGADIGEFETVRRDAETALVYERANSDAFRAIREAPFPTVAAIRGICFGGGFGLAAACDIRIAEADALFSVPAARLGLAYPVDAMRDIVAACGPQLAKLMLFSAERIGAERALAAGLLAELVPAGDLEARAEALARGIAANAPLSIRASKAAVMAVADGPDAAVAEARRLAESTFLSSDYAEGRAAFRERRRPHFLGR